MESHDEPDAYRLHYLAAAPKAKNAVDQISAEDSVRPVDEDVITPILKTSVNSIPKNNEGNGFYEKQWTGVSIEAAHFTNAVNANGISWKILPDLAEQDQPLLLSRLLQKIKNQVAMHLTCSMSSTLIAKTVLNCWLTSRPH